MPHPVRLRLQFLTGWGIGANHIDTLSAAEPCLREIAIIVPFPDGFRTNSASAADGFPCFSCAESWFQSRSMTTAVMTAAKTSAIGAAQKMPVTPHAIGAIKDAIIRKTSRNTESGAADFACPMDCRKMEQTFCAQVSVIRER